MRHIYIQKLGGDPEVFLQDRKGNPFSAEGLFGGTKYEPKPMEGLPDGFFIQEDNVAAEFNIPATGDVETWAESLQAGLKYIKTVAAKHKLKPLLSPALEFPIAQVMTPHALELGCEPDFNAWTMAKNPRPRPPERMRTAAAHIHASWEDPDDEQRWSFVKACDVFLGLPSILHTVPNNRRKLYGKAGACRLKKYGVEYRVLDNFYMASVNLSIKIGDRMYHAADRINDDDLMRREIDKCGDAIQEAINTHNKDLAAQLMNHFNVQRF
jgi:hypothetical protein